MVKVMAYLNNLHNRIPSEGSTHSMIQIKLFQTLLII